jgi:hypothetical protein
MCEQNIPFDFNVDLSGTSTILKNVKGSDKINPKLIQRIIVEKYSTGDQPLADSDSHEHFSFLLRTS